MRRLTIMSEQAQTHFSLWPVGRQQLELTFDQGPLVSDAGLLAVRALDRSLGILADLATRLPDPRSPDFIRHSTGRLLVQQVYQILAGYPDCNDADSLRHDALFQILAEQAPNGEQPLAGASTLSRFQYAYTRRGQREGEPEVLLVRRAAQTQRLKAVNAFLVELFIRTRPQVPTEIVLDADATDDPVHGKQALSGYHGYYRQHQYLPLLVFDGSSGFPLACWLRHGTAHASLGAVDVLRELVQKLRAAWPGVAIKLRADSGLAVPAIYDFCEAENIRYALGLASNPVLQRRVACATADVEEYYRAYGKRDAFVQRFEVIPDYQAESWPAPRRVVAKIERTPQGGQRRFVLSDLPLPPDEVYKDFYVQRGAVPEQPIGELKNGLGADRLSAGGFCANAWRLLVHVVAYALVVLFRAANKEVEEVAQASVNTLRQRLWKAPAVLTVGVRRLVLRLSTAWPGRELLSRVLQAVAVFVSQARGAATPGTMTGLLS
jgi:hypothetical protein